MNETATSTTNPVINFEQWHRTATGLNEQYVNADPYPHIILENFLNENTLGKVVRAFPPVTDERWIHYIHYNEKKHGLTKFGAFPEVIRQVISTLNSDEFVHGLSLITGIPGLKADPTLDGGGLHQSKPGGFLNIHSDFTSHPHKPQWRRRVNVLVYLNENWAEEYGGNLELWDRQMNSCVRSVSPLFNRCVIFSTDETSFHGHPHPLNCPEGMTRKSIALYYYSEEAGHITSRATRYKARPEDGPRKIFIQLDNQMLILYHKMRQRLGIGDSFTSKVLNTLRLTKSSKKRKKPDNN